MKSSARLWLTLVPALALGATTFGWLSRAPAPAPGTGNGALAARTDRALDADEREALALARDRSPDATRKLIELYARLAGDLGRTNARRLALGALFAEPALPLRLKRVLEAVAADPTPAGEDPLFPEITKRLAEQWTPETFDKGRDLMLMEQRPRARRALVASFVDLTTSGQEGAFGTEQKSALLTDLIDLHPLAPPDQKPPIEDAVRVLGGNDPADLLAGLGLTGGDKLELQAEYERQLQAAMKALVKN